jgi:hypothetical protein
MRVEIDGWQLVLFNDCDSMDYCEYCKSPDGRVESLETWHRCATDPVDPAEHLGAGSTETTAHQGISVRVRSGVEPGEALNWAATSTLHQKASDATVRSPNAVRAPVGQW